MIYKTDYHIHTRFSDGRGEPEEYIQPAIDAGMQEIGFSEHLTLSRDSPEWSMNSRRAESYIGYIRELEQSVKGIVVRTGLEIDYLPGREKTILSFLDRVELDYVIGSVHYLGTSTVDEGPEFYEGKDINRLFTTYFDHVSEAAASGLFDIIGHCDLIRIYGYAPSSGLEPLYRNLAKSLKAHDVALELNTNGRNRPVGDFYPDRRFLRIFREENVPVCVNSDAHMPSRVGQYFDEAYQLIRDAGYTEMAVFKKRERFMIPFE